MEWMLDIKVWSSLLTLTVLEIVLGIDNIIFITILVSRVPEKQRNFARQFGLLAAMGTRVLLLLSVAWLARLVQPLFEIMQHPVSGRDLVLFSGGLFLICKAVIEIHKANTTAAPDTLRPACLLSLGRLPSLTLFFRWTRSSPQWDLPSTFGS